MALSLEMAPADASDCRGLIQESLSRAYGRISPLKAIFDEQSQVRSAFSPDGAYFLTGLKTDSSDFAIPPRAKSCGDRSDILQVLAAAFGTDGKTILTGCHDGYARLWSLSSKAPEAKQRVNHQDIVSPWALVRRQHILSEVVMDCADVGRLSGEQVGKLPRSENQAQVLSLAVSSKDKTIVVGTEVSMGH